MGVTTIEWCDFTFNPWRGCTKVSEGCKHCYAMVLSERYKGKHGVWGPKGTRIVASDSMWREPIKWNREAEEQGERKRVFCCSLADVFEDWRGPMTCGMKDFEGSHWEVTADNQSFFVRGLRDLPMHEGARLATMDDYRENLWRLIERTPMLDWLLLTKRPENVMRMVPARWRKGFPPNVWLGTSVEDQKTADERIPHLLKCPAAVRFLSCEPLLSGVDLHRFLWCDNDERTSITGPDRHGAILSGQRGAHQSNNLADCNSDDVPSIHENREGHRSPQNLRNPFREIHWVIVGGESGPGARPMHPGWARSLRDQCVAAGVPYFFKQWGAWCPDDALSGESLTIAQNACGPDREYVAPSGEFDGMGLLPGIVTMNRVGKKKAGRILDVRTWDEFPEVTP